MQLKTLKLADFAGIPAAELEGFEPGLTVIVGDNEAGKSTLLTALRAAFFQKHRAGGEAVKAFSPYLAGGRPSVELDFEVDGVRYALKKAFLQRPMAELTWPGGSLSGDAVEEKLAALFRFTHPGAGESKLERHQGAFGLLWVEQGRSTGGLDLGAGKDAVTASLEGEVGQILGGERGRTLIAAAKALQDRFFTEKLRVVSTSPVAAAEKALASLTDELSARRKRREAVEAKLDRLDNRKASLRSLQADDSIAKAEAAAEAAEAAVRAAGDLRREVVDAAREVEHAKARRDASAERLGQRDRLIAAGTAARVARETAGRTLDDLADGETGRAARLAALGSAHAEASERVKTAERHDDAARAFGDRVRLDREIASLSPRIETARAGAAKLQTLRAALNSFRIDAKTIAALEAAERRLGEAEVRLSVAAPIAIFEPEPGRRVTDETGAEVAGGVRQTIAGRRAFHLEGFGRLTIAPGADAEALSRDHEAAGRALRDLLSKAGAETTEAARRSLARMEAQRSDIAALEREQAALVPDGLGAAEDELSRLRGEREALAQVDGGSAAGQGTAGMAEGERKEASAPFDTPTDPATTRRELRAAREALGEAEAELRQAEREGAARNAERAGAEAQLAHRVAEDERLSREAAEAEAARSRPALAEDLAAAEVERTAKAAVLDLKRAELERADPETAERALKARRGALSNLNADIGRLRDEILSLEGELKAEGSTALEEEIARLEGETEALRTRLARLTLEAEASRLLYGTLVEAQRQAREDWLEPIRQEVAPYLRLIHPGAEVHLDDSTLEISGLSRRGVAEDFRRLSAGAREQVAVVTRIALAQVLKKGGHPATVILDDALVNTDEKRLERMHMVLLKAAEELQIIVLTCRERDFRALGAPILRL